MLWWGNMQDRANDPKAPQALTVPVSDSDWSKGGKDATVTLVKYSDFQCPACATYATLVDRLHKNYGDKLRIVYRQFPLTPIHSNAQLAAQAAEAAGLQGKFWEMHTLLFSGQKDWSDDQDPTEGFTLYATGLGLNVDQFTTDLTGNAVKKSVREDVKGANSANITSTPTFFLNGLLIESPGGFEQFKKVIDAVLNPPIVIDGSATSSPITITPVITP